MTIAAPTECVVITDLAVPGAVTVNLPAGITGQIFFIVDGKGDAATNNITVDPNLAQTINGAATYVINKNRAGVLVGFNGTSWNVLAEFTNIAAGTIPRSSIAAGTANHVVINDGSGNLSSEATLAKSRGGTGADNSAVTFPSTGVIPTETSTSTLTNKTLTSPAITTPTGLVKGDVGLGNVDNTSDATKNAAAVSLTNKTINGSSNTITNIALTTAVTGTLPIANGGTGQAAKTAAFDALSPTTTKGDLVTRDSSNNIRVGVGADGTVLTADAASTGGIKWSAIGFTNPMTTTGDVITGAASGVAQRLAIGTTGQALTVVGGTPAWQTGTTGVTNGGDAAAGVVGEVFRSAAAVGAITRSTWVNIASITLTAGDWDVAGVVVAQVGTMVTPADMQVALSLFSGSTTTDHALGDNEIRCLAPTSSGNTGLSIPAWRVSSNVSNTVYLKASVNGASGAPNGGGRISARRVR